MRPIRPVRPFRRVYGGAARRIVLVGVVVQVAVASAAGAAGTSRILPGSGRIVFSSDRSVARALYTMAPDGSGVQPLTPSVPGGETPAWSPNGRRIAFEADNGTTLVHGLWLMNADGTHLRIVASWIGERFHPAWSPDSRRLLAVRDGYVWVVNADGTRARRLARGNYPAWSPNGRTIAFARGFSVWVMSPNGSRQHRLRAFPAGTYPQAAWSPNSQRLVVAARPPDSSNADLYLIRADGSMVRRLTATPLLYETSPSWAPSQRIAFTATGGTYVIDPAGGRPRLAIHGGGDASWGLQGRLAYDMQDAAGSRLYATGRGGRGRHLLLQQNDDLAPAWSPDHGTVAFTRNGVLTLIAADGTHRTSLGVRANAVTWAPDGNQLATTSGQTLAVRHRDGTLVWQLRLPPAGGDPPPLLEQPSWSPNGSEIVFTASALSGATTIYSVPAAGGAPTVLVSDSGTLTSPSQASWAPDGLHLALVGVNVGTSAGNQLAIVQADGSSPRTIYSDPHGGVANPTWSSDGNTIAFAITGRDATTQLFTFAVAGGALVQLTTPPSSSWAPNW